VRREIGPLGTLLIGAAVAAAQTVSFVKVPPEQTPGGLLAIPELRIAVTAPGPGWQWLHLTGQEETWPRKTTYVCEHTATGRRFAVTALETVAKNATPKSMEAEFVDSARKTGWEVERSLGEASDIPHPGSIRISWRGRRGNDLPQSSRVYVISSGITYTLVYQGPEEVEPADFGQFVRSFQLLPEAPAAGGSGVVETYLYYFLLLGGLGAGLIANAVARRRVVNPGAVAAIVLVVLLGLRIFGAASSPTLVGLPERSTVRQLEAVREAFWPLVIACGLFAGLRRPSSPKA
jgi:hypothetical protein